DLRAERARVPGLVELLLALRAELLLEDPEATRANRRIGVGRARSWHTGHPRRAGHTWRHSRWHSWRHSWLHLLRSLLIALRRITLLRITLWWISRLRIALRRLTRLLLHRGGLLLLFRSGPAELVVRLVDHVLAAARRRLQSTCIDLDV